VPLYLKHKKKAKSLRISFLSLTFAEEYKERGSDTNNVGILFCYVLSARHEVSGRAEIITLKNKQTKNIGGKEMAYMSEEGYNKLVAELREMETVQRPEISRQIAEARDKGDLSENSEYDAAKEAQGMLEMKINNLKAIISEAKIIDTSKLDTSTVQILSKVEMKNVKNDMKMVYTIVSESEANLREGKISVNTPIAQGLLGKKVGDVAEITIPQGKITLEIVNISF